MAAIIAGTFLLAGIAKGVVGMGFATVVMGLLGLVMPPVQAAALLVVPAFVTNVWQMVAGPALMKVSRRFATMMLGVCLGVAFGIGLLTGGTAALAAAALGGVLALYGGVGLLAGHVRVPARHEPWLSPIVGFLTGVVTGATGVFVMPAAPYLSSLGLEKEELVQALGLSFTVSTVTLAIGLAANGELHLTSVGTSLLALLPAFGGMLFGQVIRSRLRPVVFRRWFFIGLSILGTYMLARSLL